MYIDNCMNTIMHAHLCIYEYRMYMNLDTDMHINMCIQTYVYVHTEI